MSKQAIHDLLTILNKLKKAKYQKEFLLLFKDYLLLKEQLEEVEGRIEELFRYALLDSYGIAPKLGVEKDAHLNSNQRRV